MSNILSLCEMSNDDVNRCLNNGISPLKHDTVYLGSEFCWDKLVAGQDWRRLISVCHKNGNKVYFVFPILPERHINSFNILLTSLIKEGIDGVVVNDLGILYYIYRQVPSLPIVIGRLLIKSSRDYIHPCQGTKVFRFPQEIVKISQDFNCIRIDTDYGLFSKTDADDLDVEIGIHNVSYLTSTMCCDYKYDENVKYAKIDSVCKLNCMKEVIMIPESPLIKLGNVLLYYPSIADEFIADKIIIDYKCYQLIKSVR